MMKINNLTFKHGESEMTTDTFGLFLAKSCTHNKPTCMHLKISISKHGSDIIGSIKATMLCLYSTISMPGNKKIGLKFIPSILKCIRNKTRRNLLTEHI